MRHRLYYLLPDVESARRTHEDMLLARIEQRHIRFMNSGAPLPSGMPEASFLLKTDLLHGAASGMAAGVVLGLLLGVVLILYLDVAPVMVLLAVALGLVFGGWAASMVAAALPNSRLKAFFPELEKGKVLMIIDVPAGRVAEIEAMLSQRHPEMRFGGEDPHVPAFP